LKLSYSFRVSVEESYQIFFGHIRGEGVEVAIHAGQASYESVT
jgi:hypothetical protein